MDYEMIENFGRGINDDEDSLSIYDYQVDGDDSITVYIEPRWVAGDNRKDTDLLNYNKIMDKYFYSDYSVDLMEMEYSEFIKELDNIIDKMTEEFLNDYIPNSELIIKDFVQSEWRWYLECYNYESDDQININIQHSNVDYFPEHIFVEFYKDNYTGGVDYSDKFKEKFAAGLDNDYDNFVIFSNDYNNDELYIKMKVKLINFGNFKDRSLSNIYDSFLESNDWNRFVKGHISASNLADKWNDDFYEQVVNSESFIDLEDFLTSELHRAAEKAYESGDINYNTNTSVKESEFSLSLLKEDYFDADILDEIKKQEIANM